METNEKNEKKEKKEKKEREDLTVELGKHCSFPGCNRLDFLPVKCKHCLQVFCTYHSGITSHNCPSINTQNNNEGGRSSNSSTKSSDPKASSIYFKCSLAGCFVDNELAECICEFCGFNFCRKHRHPSDHACTAKQVLDEAVETKARAREQLQAQHRKEFNFEMKHKVKPKNLALNAKLMLMKLRQTAVGVKGLPEESRFYCYVDCKLDGKLGKIGKKPFFFNTKWPIGKCVEFLMEKMSIDERHLHDLKLFLEDQLVDSSYLVDEMVAKASLTPGTLFELKLFSN